MAFKTERDVRRLCVRTHKNGRKIDVLCCVLVRILIKSLLRSFHLISDYYGFKKTFIFCVS